MRPDVSLILQLLLLIFALTLYRIPFIDGRAGSLLADREPVAQGRNSVYEPGRCLVQGARTRLSLEDSMTSVLPETKD